MKIINQMLNKYNLLTLEDRKNAIKEIVQEIVLSGIARSNFFNVGAFYGGTALRIFYDLNRFSEDLDFTLINPNPNFNLENYIKVVKNEVEALGLKFDVVEKEKRIDTDIRSVFVKGNTLEQFLVFYPNNDDESGLLHKDEIVKIKFEIDTNPPKFATTEIKYRLLPYPYQVRIYDLPSLFAGKIDAILSRSWKNRVKGRDFYDFIYFISINTPVNIKHLKERLVQSKYIDTNFDLNELTLKELLYRKFEKVDFKVAKKDVLPFIEDSRSLEIWSKDFFVDITKNIKVL